MKLSIFLSRFIRIVLHTHPEQFTMGTWEETKGLLSINSTKQHRWIHKCPLERLCPAKVGRNQKHR